MVNEFLIGGGGERGSKRGILGEKFKYEGRVWTYSSSVKSAKEEPSSSRTCVSWLLVCA